MLDEAGAAIDAARVRVCAMTVKPPPLPQPPPRKPPAKLSRSRARNPVPSPGVYAGEEEPTRPQGIEFRVALMARYFRLCSPEDQAHLLLEAERWAARNAKT